MEESLINVSLISNNVQEIQRILKVSRRYPNTHISMYILNAFLGKCVKKKKVFYKVLGLLTAFLNYLLRVYKSKGIG